MSRKIITTFEAVTKTFGQRPEHVCFGHDPEETMKRALDLLKQPVRIREVQVDSDGKVVGFVQRTEGVISGNRNHPPFGVTMMEIVTVDPYGSLSWDPLT